MAIWWWNLGIQMQSGMCWTLLIYIYICNFKDTCILQFAQTNANLRNLCILGSFFLSSRISPIKFAFFHYDTLRAILASSLWSLVISGPLCVLKVRSTPTSFSFSTANFGHWKCEVISLFETRFCTFVWDSKILLKGFLVLGMPGNVSSFPQWFFNALKVANEAGLGAWVWV